MKIKIVLNVVVIFENVLNVKMILDSLIKYAQTVQLIYVLNVKKSNLLKEKLKYVNFVQKVLIYTKILALKNVLMVSYKLQKHA